MPKLRIGVPLKGNFSNLSWNDIPVFEVPQILRSVLVGSTVSALFVVAWKLADSGSLPLGTPSGYDFLIMLSSVLAHEILHMMGFPRLGLDGQTVLGIWPKMVAPYVQHLAPMKRNRFLLAVLLPFMVLSIVPLALLSIGIGPVAYLSWISVGNCVGAGSDLYIFGKVLSIVPANASVLESDGKIFWSQARAQALPTESLATSVL